MFSEDVYEFNSIHPAFDLLTGGSEIRKMILKGVSFEEIIHYCGKDESAFSHTKKEFHLYDS